MEHAGFRVGYVGSDGCQLQPSHKLFRAGAAPFYAEGDDTAGALGHIFPGQVVAGVAGQAGMTHPAHLIAVL
ncbi:hypothetical protein SDC9_176748 [bioreactor metagenome]|uniref:Uncharacterized protein n=1 Tax=bioreactor metagenome TaxID=1076179 RepID=A0A645GSV0_9ZZZZ